jgi:hypothetical protein
MQYLIFPINGTSFVMDLGAEIKHSIAESTDNPYEPFIRIPLGLKSRSSIGTNSPEGFLTFKVIYFRYISGTTYLSSLRLSFISHSNPMTQPLHPFSGKRNVFQISRLILFLQIQSSLLIVRSKEA